MRIDASSKTIPVTSGTTGVNFGDRSVIISSSSGIETRSFILIKVTAGIRFSDDQHRTRRVADNRIGNRTEKHPFEPAVTV